MFPSDIQPGHRSQQENPETSSAVQGARLGEDRRGTGLLIIGKAEELVGLVRGLCAQEGWAATVVQAHVDFHALLDTQSFAAALIVPERSVSDATVTIEALRGADRLLPIVLLTRERLATDLTLSLLQYGVYTWLNESFDRDVLRLVLRNTLSFGTWRWKAARAEQALASSETRFRAVVESAVDAIVLASAEGTIVSWNKAAEALFHYTEDEMRGQPVTTIMPPRYREAHQKALARFQASGQGSMMGRPVELHGLRKDGSEFPLELSLAAWRTEEGVFFSGIIRDISERKRIETALRASEERLDVAVRGSNDGLWDLQPVAGEPWYSPRSSVWFSPRFREMLGYSDEEFGHTLEAWIAQVHHQDRSRLYDAIRAHVEHKEPLDLECRIRTKAGEYQWFRARGRGLWDADDGLIRLAGSLQCITDRKQAEEKLRAAEERYRSIFEHAVEGIFQETPDGRFLIVNPSFARMLGYSTPHELVSSISDIGRQLYVHVERHQAFRAVMESPGLIKGFEAQLRRKDGTFIWVAISARAVHLPNSAWRYYEGITENITARKKQADRLAKLNECLLRFGNNADENINRLTALCGELLGGGWALYSRLSGGMLHAVGRWRTPADLPDASDPGGHLCAEVLSQGGDRPYVFRHLSDSSFAETDPAVRAYGLQSYVGQAVRRGSSYVGTLCVVYTRDFNPTQSDRRLLGIIASAIGVEEERKAADETTRRALHQTDLILESLPSAILVVQADLTIVKANALAHRYFATEPRALTGRSLTAILPEQEIKRIRLAFDAAPYSAERGYWRQDREFHAGNRIYRYRCFTVVLGPGEGAHTGLVVWDVTEEKTLQDQLIQTEKLAGLGSMVSGMAHEINNPAQAILGLAELIPEESPEKVREFSADIADYARHIASVVRDFVSYARLTSREGDTDTDLNERLKEAVKMVRRGPYFGQIEVVVHFRSIPPIRARGQEIEQVFVNLIGNAVQAMKGKGSLTLATWHQADLVFASISDTGPGIPAHLLPRIFEPFFTTKNPGEGTGLGLCIVHKIVTKYAGTIRVESREGRGTSFTLQFPTQAVSGGGP